MQIPKLQSQTRIKHHRVIKSEGSSPEVEVTQDCREKREDGISPLQFLTRGLLKQRFFPH